MAFLNILNKDFRTLLRCVNYKKLYHANLNKAVYDRRVNYCSEERSPFIPKPISDKTVSQLMRYDNISSEFTLIYRARKTFSYSMVHACLLICCPVCSILMLYIAFENDFKFPCLLGDNIVIKNFAQLAVVVGISSLVFYFMVAAVTRFPFRLYRGKNNEFVAVFPNLFIPWRMHKVNFKRGDLKIEEEPKVLPFQIGNFSIKNRKVVLEEEFFVRPYELDNMLSKGN